LLEETYRSIFAVVEVPEFQKSWRSGSTKNLIEFPSEMADSPSDPQVFEEQISMKSHF